MMVKGAKALEVWCRRVTEGYPVSFDDFVRKQINRFFTVRTD